MHDIDRPNELPEEITFAARVHSSERDYFIEARSPDPARPLSGGLDSPAEETEVGIDGEFGKSYAAGSAGPAGHDLFRMQVQRRTTGAPPLSFRCMCSLHLSSSFY